MLNADNIIQRRIPLALCSSNDQKIIFVVNNVFFGISPQHAFRSLHAMSSLICPHFKFECATNNTGYMAFKQLAIRSMWKVRQKTQIGKIENLTPRQVTFPKWLKRCLLCGEC